MNIEMTAEQLDERLGQEREAVKMALQKEQLEKENVELQNSLKTLSTSIDTLNDKVNTLSTSTIKVNEKADKWLGMALIAKATAEVKRTSFATELESLNQRIGTADTAFALKSFETFKSQNVVNPSEGGLFTDPNLQGSLIQMLQPLSIVRTLPNIQQISFTGSDIVLPRQLTGTMFNWVATDSVLSEESTATFSTLVLRRKKLLGHVLITNDMLAQDLYGMATIIQNDMLRNLALTEDRGFIYGDGGNGKPVGLNNITGISSDARTTTPDTAKIRKDLLRAKNHLNSNDLMDDGSRVWIMTPSIANAISGREITGGDLANYARELFERNTLLGYRVIQTTSQETGVITLVQASQLIIGNGTILQLDRDDSVKFLNDSIAIRGKHSADINVSHAKAIAKITSVTDWE